MLKCKYMTITAVLTRGVMLDDDWREAGYSYSIFVSQISPQIGYDILRCRNDDWTSSLQYISISSDTTLIQDPIGEKVSA